jgi:cation diffusion facilitator family transporter
MTKKEKLKKGEKAAGIITLLIGLLAGVKALAGFLSGSVILLSDAFHSGSDVISSLASWFGLKIAQRKPDEKFPYGYYKAENLATGLIAILIIGAGIEFFQEGYRGLYELSTLKLAFLALTVAAISAVFDFFSSRYLKRVGQEINSQALLTNAAEKRADVFASSIVFLGIFLSYLKIPYIEGLVTIGISLLLLKIGLTSAKDSVFALMDISPSKVVEKKVIRAIKSVPGIEEFFDLRLRKAGPFIFGETKVGVRKFIDVRRAYEIADKVEEAIKKEVSQIDSFSIHIEPFKSNYRHLVIPIITKKGLSSLVADKFGRAPSFLFVNLEGRKIKGYYLLDNPFKDQKVRAGLAAAKLLVKQKSEVLITKEVGEISFHALRDNLFDIYQAKGEKAKTVIDNFLKRELEMLSRPTREKA